MTGMAELIISRVELGSKGKYTGRYIGLPEAAMTYSRASPQLIIIDHTEVPAELKGKGVGQKLVERAVSDARAANTKIMPLCPFAKAQFDRHPDWADVLHS